MFCIRITNALGSRVLYAVNAVTEALCMLLHSYRLSQTKLCIVITLWQFI